MRRADNLTAVIIALRSGSLNLMETSGSVQVRNGIALLLPLLMMLMPVNLADVR